MKKVYEIIKGNLKSYLMKNGAVVIDSSIDDHKLLIVEKNRIMYVDVHASGRKNVDGKKLWSITINENKEWSEPFFVTSTERNFREVYEKLEIDQSISSFDKIIYALS